MSNAVCRYLTNGLRVQAWGNNTLAASPCCYLPQVDITDPGFSQTMKDYNQRTACYNCLSFVNGDTNNPNYPPTLAQHRIDDVDHTHPVFAELSIDTRCNAACLMCSDSFSTMWAEQNIRYKIKTLDDYPDPQNDELIVENLFKQFNWSHLRVLNFMGGEPLISQANALVMQRLIDTGVASNIDLIFTTNGSTLITEQQQKTFLHFKSVSFSYSVDGTEQQFHYLRYPLNWSKLQKSIASARELSKLMKVHIGINMTVGALNIFSVNQVQEWARSLSPAINSVETPACNDIMSLSALPESARKMLRHRYSDQSRLLGQLSGPYSIEAQDKLLKYLDAWDQRRGLDWRATFPEAADYLK